ncbi:MAG: hypothetical protein HY234_05285 [Acidobacteria bacterium]|nr:hypothetical protein [Acidobacteriota bacterium]MBI3662447.1 hypothetical protein [Acidobacteriota bacterium]
MRFLLTILLLAGGATVAADELRLKDGTKIVGNIVGYEGDSFKVETSYGFALVKKDKVASIIVSEAKADAKKPAAAEAKAPSPPPPARTNPPPIAPAANTAPAKAQPAAKLVEAPMREEVEGTRYTNLTFGFRLYKPPSWSVIEGARKTLPTAVVVMGTVDQTTLFIVGREPLQKTIEQHAAATERRLRELYENYRAAGERRSTVAGFAALEKRFRGMVDEHDWSVTVLTFAREKDIFTLIGMTYADSDLIQIQENVIARTIASLEFTK